MRRSRAIVLAAALAIGGCGGGDDDPAPGAGAPAQRTGTGTAAEQPSPRTPPDATVAVRETEYELDPAQARVDETGVIRIEVENAGEAVHALELEAPGGEVTTGEIAPGGSGFVVAAIDEPGRYVWYCPIGDHRERGMEGALTVSGREREPDGDADRDGGRGGRSDDGGTRADPGARDGREDPGARDGGDDPGARDGGEDPGAQLTPEEKERRRREARGGESPY